MWQSWQQHAVDEILDENQTRNNDRAASGGDKRAVPVADVLTASTEQDVNASSRTEAAEPHASPPRHDADDALKRKLSSGSRRASPKTSKRGSNPTLSPGKSKSKRSGSKSGTSTPTKTRPVSTLRSLLQSTNADRRRDGRLWLFALVRAMCDVQVCVDCACLFFHFFFRFILICVCLKKKNKKTKNKGRGRELSAGVVGITERLLAELCATVNPLIAREYLLVIERVTLWLRSSMQHTPLSPSDTDTNINNNSNNSNNSNNDPSSLKHGLQSLLNIVNSRFLAFIKARRRLRRRSHARQPGDIQNAILILDVVVRILLCFCLMVFFFLNLKISFSTRLHSWI